MTPILPSPRETEGDHHGDTERGGSNEGSRSCPCAATPFLGLRVPGGPRVPASQPASWPARVASRTAVEVPRASSTPTVGRPPGAARHPPTCFRTICARLRRYRQRNATFGWPSRACMWRRKVGASAVSQRRWFWAARRSASEITEHVYRSIVRLHPKAEDFLLRHACTGKHHRGMLTRARKVHVRTRPKERPCGSDVSTWRSQGREGPRECPNL